MHSYTYGCIYTRHLSVEHSKGLRDECNCTGAKATNLSSVGVDAVDDGLDFLFEHSVCGRVSNHQGSLDVFKGERV
jgi:hypothetical protein